MVIKRKIYGGESLRSAVEVFQYFRYNHIIKIIIKVNYVPYQTK